MKRIALLIITLCLFALAAQAQTPQTPQPPTTPGPVWRITEYRIKPDKAADFMKYLREHSVQLLAEQKRQGLIVDYKFFFSPTNGGSQDADIKQAVLYRNFAEALDNDPERGKKLGEISLKHFGTAENRTKVNEQLPAMREMLRSYLQREYTINPLKSGAAGN